MNRKKVLLFLVCVAAMLFPEALFAEEASASFLDTVGQYGPIGGGLGIGLAVLGGGIGQGKLVASALDAIGRNPSASGPIRTTMLISIVFPESLVILAFVVALKYAP